MKKISLRALVLSRLVTSFSKLRKNASGYYYVTLLHGSKSQNVYLSKTSTAILNAEGDMEGKPVPSNLMKHAEVIETMNDKKEVRFKLSFSAGGDYTSSSELSELFGVQEEVGEFNLAGFTAEFTAQAAPEEKPEPANGGASVA